MKSDRLPVEVLDQRENEARQRKVDELKKQQASRKAMGPRVGINGHQEELRSSQPEFAGSSSQGQSRLPEQSLEQIMEESHRFNPREMGEIVEKFGVGEDFLSKMPMADLPGRLATKLLPYQRQGLAWLLEKENPKLPPPGSTEVVQLWKRCSLDPRLFTNIATNFSLKDPPLARGGILAVSLSSAGTRLVPAR
jgi:SWI/SNF-related matrix-associated actin-dependent regulator of chromatin subfamily A3